MTWEAALRLSRQELKAALPRQGVQPDNTRGGASALGTLGCEQGGGELGEQRAPSCIGRHPTRGKTETPQVKRLPRDRAPGCQSLPRLAECWKPPATAGPGSGPSKPVPPRWPGLPPTVRKPSVFSKLSSRSQSLRSGAGLRSARPRRAEPGGKCSPQAPDFPSTLIPERLIHPKQTGPGLCSGCTAGPGGPQQLL